MAHGTPTNFEAVNMAVIPNDGRVIVWDFNGGSQSSPGMGVPWPQRFAVGDVEAQPPAFTNYTVTIPLAPGGVFWGDMFCSGHVWLPDGRLFVAGGNSRYPSVGAEYFEGSQLAAIWDRLTANVPPNYGWTWLPSMNKKRWYPTVTLFIDTGGLPRVMVSGGVESTANDFCGMGNDGAFNTYEVWNIGSGNWERVSPTSPPTLYNGPSPSCWSVFGEYPRNHLVSTNHVFVAGMFTGSNRVRHNSVLGPAQVWATQPWDTGNFRHYGSSVLLPNVGNTPGGQDLIMILGGHTKNGGYANFSLDSCKVIDGGATSPSWTITDSLSVGRMCANAVLLPNGEVLAVGGCYTNYFDANTPRAPVFAAEVYNKIGGWTYDSHQSSPRMYHSTAVLLPSGKVMSGGGDIRTSDYEVFTPSYLANGQVRPTFAGTWGNTGSLSLQWGTQYWIEYDDLPVGVTISRVVLMRPCSVTHHSDMDQRYVELHNVKLTPPYPDNTIVVQTPNAPTGGTARGSTEAPPGWYMAFLVTSSGTPSLAKWVFLP